MLAGFLRMSVKLFNNIEHDVHKALLDETIGNVSYLKHIITQWHKSRKLTLDNEVWLWCLPWFLEWAPGRQLGTEHQHSQLCWLAICFVRRFLPTTFFSISHIIRPFSPTYNICSEAKTYITNTRSAKHISKREYIRCKNPQCSLWWLWASECHSTVKNGCHAFLDGHLLWTSQITLCRGSSAHSFNPFREVYIEVRG